LAASIVWIVDDGISVTRPAGQTLLEIEELSLPLLQQDVDARGDL
jgi:hypothetical protein